MRCFWLMLLLTACLALPGCEAYRRSNDSLKKSKVEPPASLERMEKRGEKSSID